MHDKAHIREKTREVILRSSVKQPADKFLSAGILFSSITPLLEPGEAAKEKSLENLVFSRLFMAEGVGFEPTWA